MKKSIPSVLISTVFIILLSVSSQTVHSGTDFARQQEAKRTLLNFSSQSGAYLTKSHSIPMTAGTNRLRITLDAGRIDSDSLRLVPAAPGVRVIELSFLDDKTVIVTMRSQSTTTVPVTLFAHLEGFSRETTYRMELDTGDRFMLLSEDQTLKNRTDFT
ncbi:MAG: hypothetical protein ABEJ65_05175, partial [bacterium]